MRRHAHANPFVRRKLKPLLDEIKSKATSEWPRHFNLAWQILHDELDVACPCRKFHPVGVRRRIGCSSAGCWISAE